MEVIVRVPRSQVRYLRGARVLEDGEPTPVVTEYEGPEHAFHSLLGWGASAEVLAPAALRERIAASAAETLALYSETATPA
jgi:predicted DNA-binding transcriptional regulator YafY